MKSRVRSQEQKVSIRFSLLLTTDSLLGFGCIEFDDFENHLRRQIEIFQIEPFVDRVDLAHAGAEVGDYQPFLIQNIGVAAAAGGAGFDVEMQISRGGVNQLDDGGAFRHIHAVVVALDLGFDPRLMALAVELQRMSGGGCFEAAAAYVRSGV